MWSKIVGSKLLLLCCFPGLVFPQNKRSVDVDHPSLIEVFENFYFGNTVMELDVDDFLDFHAGYMIVRKAENYAVINDFGSVVVPFGQYLFDFREERERREQGVFHHFGVLVRSPETGLYGLLNPATGQEIAPCIYNELTPFYRELEHAIGTKADLETGKRIRYFVDMVGNEIFMHEELELITARPSRFLKYRYKKDGVTTFYDAWEHRDYLSTEYDARYFGGNRYYVRRSVNQLNQFALLNHFGEIVAPFQLSDHIWQIQPFQAVYNPSTAQYEYVSVLIGSGSSYFDYALMDTTGNIYNRLRTGGEWQSLKIDDHSIKNGRVLLKASKSIDKSAGAYLWNMFENEPLMSIEEMYGDNLEKVRPLIDRIVDFRVEGRDGNHVLFHCGIDFIGPEYIHQMFPTAVSKNFYGGVDTGHEKPVNSYKYSLYGYGLLNETTGEVDVEPIFQVLKLPDYPFSNLAYAELKYNDVVYRGFIETTGELAGSFRFLLK